MFRFLPVTLDIKTHYCSALTVGILTGFLMLTGCEQQPNSATETDVDQASESVVVEDSQPMPQSDSAAARIEQFQPIYVAQAQGLQRRLQAEYESLQAADALDTEQSLLVNNTADNTSDNADNRDNADNSANANQMANTENTPDIATNDTSTGQATPMDQEAPAMALDEEAIETDVNTSTEVGERDLTVLKRISLEPRKPVMLTEEQLIVQYQQTMAALYQPVTTLLSAEESDTLINIATLVPQLFEHAEIAGRVSAKSPALARLIIQHQVWEQIEAQQVVDMQQMKQDQQQEFEALMTKFNETIKGYDEQIAKYEQTLKEFQ